MIEGLSGRYPLLMYRVGLTRLINDVELVVSLKKKMTENVVMEHATSKNCVSMQTVHSPLIKIEGY